MDHMPAKRCNPKFCVGWCGLVTTVIPMVLQVAEGGLWEGSSSHF